MSKEDEYDQIVEPLARKVAEICKEIGMSCIIRIEWEPGESGIIIAGDTNWSPGQKLTADAAHANGNIDALCIHLLRECGVGNSIILRQYQSKYRDLIIFLAACVDSMADSRHKALACKDLKSMRTALALHFPVVQGMECQNQIREISKLSFNGEMSYEQGEDFLKDMKRG